VLPLAKSSSGRLRLVCREMLQIPPSPCVVNRASTPERTGLTGLQQPLHEATLLFYMSEEGKEGRKSIFQQGRKPDLLEIPETTVRAVEAGIEIDEGSG